MVKDGSNTYLYGYSQVDNAPEINVWGAVLMGAAVLVFVLYLLYAFTRRWFSSRGRMDPCAAGAFRLAAARNDIAALEVISRIKWFNIEADVLGFTALHAAAAQGHADAICWLCQHGADCKRVKADSWKDTALHYAAASGRLPAVQALLAAGCDPAAKNYAGATPADVAARKGRNAVAVYLTNVTSGQQPLPSKAELIDNRKFSWSYEGLSDNSVAVDLSVANSIDPTHKPGAQKPSEAGDKPSAAPGQISVTASSVSQQPPAAPTNFSPQALQQAIQQLSRREFTGLGTEGTEPKFTLTAYRALAVLQTLAGVCYLAWRALRSLTPKWGYFYSVTIWLCEFCGMTFAELFLLGLWSQVERPARFLSDMFPEDDFPHVDVFVVCYTEGPDIVEPTAIAAVNMNYPGAKLHVHVLDDGKNPGMASMVNKLSCQMRYMGRQASLQYIARDKVKGVPHHAKAGNINSALLKEGSGLGEFILILDSDMLVHPDFLLRTLGHFYISEGQGWARKRKCAFLQTPQDFWNVAAGDPMCHCGRFFYGPVLQGRDGIGAGPCCGTGVVFQRDVLLSNGGQSYGSITEDYNTAMNLLAHGFSSMYLNERLSYGMVPEEITSMFSQRLRWTMGSLQILLSTNPLRIQGLSLAQSFLFFDACIYPLLAFGTATLSLIPMIYVFAEYSPTVAPRMYEFVAAFGGYYLLNRITLWWVYRGAEGSDHELWRNLQSMFWLCPTLMQACFKVGWAELSALKCWKSKREIAFKVTKKDKEAVVSGWREFQKGLKIVWPHLTYYVLFIVAVILFVVRCAVGYYTLWRAMLILVGLGWGVLVLLCLWPPLLLLLPRVETPQGWKVTWLPYRTAQDASTHAATQRARMTGTPNAPVTPRRVSWFGMRATGTPARSVSNRAPSLFTGLPDVDIAAQETVQQLASQPFQWNKREASFDAPGAAATPFGDEKVQARARAAAEQQAASHQAALREISDASAHGQNVGAVLPNIQALSLSAQQRSLSAHRRLPSMAENEYVSGIGGAEEQAWETFQPDAYNTGMIGLPSHRNNVLRNSALLTGIVLPERVDSLTQPVVLLESDGSFGPAPVHLGLQRKSAYRVSSPRSAIVGDHVATQVSAGADASKDGKRSSFSLFRPPSRFTGSPRAAASRQPSSKSPHPAAPLERLGTAFVIPTEPASIYEHTIMARPNFENRQPPASNYMFLSVHILMLAAAIIGSVYDYYKHPTLPVSGSRN